MLINSQNKGIYERILTAKNGQLVRVTFAVVEVNGIMRGRIISVAAVVSVAGQAIAANAAISVPEQLYLPTSVQYDIATAIETIFVKARISPFVKFEFFMSQPTRAPSL